MNGDVLLKFKAVQVISNLVDEGVDTKIAEAKRKKPNAWRSFSSNEKYKKASDREKKVLERLMLEGIEPTSVAMKSQPLPWIVKCPSSNKGEAMKISIRNL